MINKLGFTVPQCQQKPAFKSAKIDSLVKDTIAKAKVDGSPKNASMTYKKLLKVKNELTEKHLQDMREALEVGVQGVWTGVLEFFTKPKSH